MATKLVDRILSFNANRDQELVRRKYRALRQDEFTFYRGTCHLFYQDWPARSALNHAPAVWICGDLHLENFGTYKGMNRLIYFGLNDFDEGALAPCTWDVARLVTSILVARHRLNIANQEAHHLCELFLDTYSAMLSQGQIRTLERKRAKGIVKILLKTLQRRTWEAFLDQRTVQKRDERRLKIDDQRFLKVTQPAHDKVAGLIKEWAASQHEPAYFTVLDVAQRVAGTGSLGLKRYAILVRGNRSPNRNRLLDLKEQPASCLQPYLSQKQPGWSNEAARVVEIQKRVQAVTPWLLSALTLDGTAFVLREYQPTEDRVQLELGSGAVKALRSTIEQMAQVTAWGQLHSCGRQGSAAVDDLINFALQTDWRKAILDYAEKYAVQVLPIMKPIPALMIKARSHPERRRWQQSYTQ